GGQFEVDVAAVGHQAHVAVAAGAPGLGRPGRLGGGAFRPALRPTLGPLGPCRTFRPALGPFGPCRAFRPTLGPTFGPAFGPAPGAGHADVGGGFVEQVAADANVLVPGGDVEVEDLLLVTFRRFDAGGRVGRCVDGGLAEHQLGVAADA